MERVQHLDSDGKLITQSLTDYTKKTVRNEFADLADFLSNWTAAAKKTQVIEALEASEVYFEALADQVGRDFDPFDLICHVAFDQPPLTRRERAENVKKQNYFTKYGDQARGVLETLLDKYAHQGLRAIEKMDILKMCPLDTIGTPIEIVKLFGGKAQYLAALRELEAMGQADSRGD